MKTFLIFPILIGAALFSLEMNGFAQGAAGDATVAPVPTTGAGRPGFAVQDGIVYFVQKGRVTPVNESLLPRGQIMTRSGKLVAASASNYGFVLEKGVVYSVRAGVRVRVDTGLIPGGQMMTVEGLVVPLPQGTTGFPGVRVITLPGQGRTPAEE